MTKSMARRPAQPRDRKAFPSPGGSSTPAILSSSTTPNDFLERPPPDLPPLEEATAELVDPAQPPPDFAPIAPPRLPSAPPVRLGVAPEVAAAQAQFDRASAAAGLSGSEPASPSSSSGKPPRLRIDGKPWGHTGPKGPRRPPEEPLPADTSRPGVPDLRSTHGGPQQPKLNHALIESVCAFVRLGVAPEVAAGSQGVTRELFAAWADKGRRGKGIYKRFVEALQKAADEFEVLAMARWNEAAAKDWRANATLLEATRPERFRPAPGRGAGSAPAGLPAGGTGTGGNGALAPAPIRIFLPPEAVVRPAGAAESVARVPVSAPSSTGSAAVSSSRAVPAPAESGGGIDLGQVDDEGDADEGDADEEDEGEELDDEAPEADAPAAE